MQKGCGCLSSNVGTHWNRAYDQGNSTKCEFPTGISIGKTVREVKQACLACQKAEPPNWQVARKIDAMPVPDNFFASVCIDIFSMPTETWEDQMYDAMVVCVDRLSGWIVAHTKIRGES